LDFFESNVQALCRTNPNLEPSLRQVRKQVDRSRFQVRGDGKGANMVQTLPSGERMLWYDEKTPHESCRQWVEGISRTEINGRVLTIVGLGLGHHIRALLEAMNDNTLCFVIETDASAFIVALESVDLSDLLSHPRVRFYIGADCAGAIQSLWNVGGVSRLVCHSTQMVLYPAVRHVYAEFIEQLRQQLENAIERERMYTRTRIKVGERVVRHTLGNIRHIRCAPGLANLEKLASRMPCVLVSAGPSLSNDLEKLRSVADRVLIIAVNTACRILDSAGIAPDIVVVVDSSPLTLDHFQGVTPQPSTILLAEPRVPPAVLDMYEGQLALLNWALSEQPVQSGNALYQLLQQTTGEKGRISSWGSVSISCVEVAWKLGCPRITLLGQDLSLEGDKTHAEGTMYDGADIAFDKDAVATVKGMDGENRPTSLTLRLYKDILEQWVANSPVPVYNSACFGAAIEGVTRKSLEEVAASSPLDKAPLLTALKQFSPVPQSDLAARLKDFMRTGREVAKMLKRTRELIRDTAKTESERIIEADRQMEQLQGRTALWAPLNEMLQRPCFEFQQRSLDLLLEDSTPDSAVELKRREEYLAELVSTVEKFSEWIDEAGKNNL
jgi:hypothetical protein